MNKYSHAVFIVAICSLLLAQFGECSSSIFVDWQQFADQRGDSELKAAVTCLQYREPQLLYRFSLRRMATAVLSPKNKKDAKYIEGQKRALKVLRMEDFLKDEEVCRAYAYLCKLPRKDQLEMDRLAQLTFKAFITSGYRNKSGAIGVLQKKALNLPTDMKPLYPVYRANAYACWANQKTIAGALEMYNLDMNTSVKKLDSHMFSKLKEHKYLRTIPQDPGYGSDSSCHYKLTPQGDIYCTHHGFIIPPKGTTADTTIREQLKLHGIKDKVLLDQCADIPVIPNK